MTNKEIIDEVVKVYFSENCSVEEALKRVKERYGIKQMKLDAIRKK